MKAAAFSDSDWLLHWNSSGPSLLARKWSSLHPHIALSSVETATGLRFLVPASGEMGEVGGSGKEGMGEIMRATGALEIAGDKECERSHDPILTPPTDDEIRRLWNEMYNSQYWYWFQQWREERRGEVEKEEEVEEVADQDCVEEVCDGGGCGEGECEDEEMGDGGDEGEDDEVGDNGKSTSITTCTCFSSMNTTVVKTFMNIIRKYQMLSAGMTGGCFLVAMGFWVPCVLNVCVWGTFTFTSSVCGFFTCRQHGS